MPEKKKFKFNVIDAIVVVVLLAALCFAGYKLLWEPRSPENTTSTTYRVTYFCEEVPDFAAAAIQNGTPISDEQKDTPLGTLIEEPVIEPSVSYAYDAEGNWKASSKPGYNSVKLTAEVTISGTPYQHGFQVGEMKYGVGHTLAFRVGYAKLYGRISDIEIVK